MKKNSRKPYLPKFQPSKRVLILCEGQSEQIYINGYKSEDVNKRRLAMVDVEIYQPKNYSPHGLLTEAKKKVKEAKKDKMPYESVWIVFDRDGHANVPQTFEEARVSKINIAFSSVCFEIWILLHFEKTSRQFQNCDDIIHFIKHKGYLNYEKTNFYNQLSPEHKQNAIINAVWLHVYNDNDIKRGIPIYQLNPYTDFDRLMKYLHSL
ncbi:MAG: RloB family protein [Paludibacter sp.]